MDLEAKKIALRKFPHGVYVIGVCEGGRASAFTGTWLTQASFAPPLVALGVRKDSHSFQMLTRGRVFSVNILGKAHKAIAEHFVKPAPDPAEKLAAFKHRAGTTGAPILEEAIAYLECEVREVSGALGDHAVVLGEVVDAGVRDAAAPALTLLDTGWHYGG
jgi:flavin reductase (DIM6/NTAB) family NADH-FMN oxidoreductase RutF